MVRPVAASLRALLSNLIDYAGLYPPAALPMPIVIERYRGFLASPDRWMLNRLVLPATSLSGLALQPEWRITLLVDGEPGPLPFQVETLETKQSAKFSLPTYCEIPLTEIDGSWAKVRTGGMTPEAIPSTEEIAAFLCEAAGRGLPFKATAGLHHPIRSSYALTYAQNSPRAVMHGFLNVFVGACFAWYGAGRETVIEVLNETAVRALEFGEQCFEWRGRSLTTDQIVEARRQFAHSFGSCSFEEPLSDLRQLELLP